MLKGRASEINDEEVFCIMREAHVAEVSRNILRWRGHTPRQKQSYRPKKGWYLRVENDQTHDKIVEPSSVSGPIWHLTRGSLARGRLDGPESRCCWSVRDEENHRSWWWICRTMERGGRRAEARRTQDPIERD